MSHNIRLPNAIYAKTQVTFYADRLDTICDYRSSFLCSEILALFLLYLSGKVRHVMKVARNI